MKKQQRLLSLLLTLCMAVLLLSSPPAVIDAIAADLSQSINQPAETLRLPDIVTSEETRLHGYVGRLAEQETDLYTFVFRNEDGSNTMRVYDYPVKYINQDGVIRDISLELAPAADGSLVSADHEICTTFEQTLSDGITLTYDRLEITLLPSDVSAAATLSSDRKTVTYKQDSRTSYEYTLTYTGFKEDIVVSEYTGQTEYDFTLRTNGLSICERYGSYYLVDETGKIQASIGDIIVFTADERNNTLGSLSYETVIENEEYRLTILLDAEYLADEKTAYPIRIDPTIEVATGTGAIEDVTINSLQGSDGSSSSLFVGKRATYGISRTLMKFPLLDLSIVTDSNNILSATVEIRDVLCESDAMTVYCYAFAGSAWSESSASWSSLNPNAYTTPLSDKTVSYSNGVANSHYYAFNILESVRGWKDGSYSQGAGIIFKANPTVENASSNQCKTFASYNRASGKPSLTITYDNAVTSPLTLNKSSVVLGINGTTTLSAANIPSGKTITWSSVNTNIATINSNGIITAKEIGTTTIQASIDGSVKATCNVAVCYDTVGFQTNSVYYIKNVCYDKYLTVAQALDITQTEVIGTDFSGNTSQQWRLTLCDINTYTLYAGCSLTNKVLDITNEHVDIYSNIDAGCQKFEIIRQDTLLYGKSGQYYIKYNGKYLTLSLDHQTLELTTSADVNLGRSLWVFESTYKGNAGLFSCWNEQMSFAENLCNNFKSNCSEMGYSSYSVDQANSNQALLALKNDSIWVHCGHGNAGVMAFYDGSGNATTIDTIDIAIIETNKLAGLKCFITIGCYSGSDNQEGKNLIESVYKKGAQFALGWTNKTSNPSIEWWLDAFFDASASGSTIQEAMEYADLHAGTNGTKYYIGDDRQRLVR